jgi:hypothetical protein
MTQTKRLPRPRRHTLAALALAGISLSGCADVGFPDMSNMMAPHLPAMGWDGRPEATSWTQASLLAVAEQDAVLASRIPADVEEWCPGYVEAGVNDRRAFWSGLLSALAKHESSWNPRAAGGGGRWIGLMQISPATARTHGCDATNSAALKDGEANLECAVQIMAAQVASDGEVSGTRGTRGIGRDWAPLRSSSKRSEMQDWTASQEYCQE